MSLLRRFWPLLAPLGLLGVAAVLGVLASTVVLERAVILALISVGLTVGLYTFSGNSGILSFGHLTFMAVGAYVSGWLTVPVTLKGLYYDFPPPLGFLETAQASPFVAILIATVAAAVFAAIVGIAISRLASMEASIATLALLLVVNVVIANWDTVTQGQRTVVGVPNVIGVPSSLGFAVVAVIAAYAYQTSRSGRRLRASREEVEAARVIGVNVVRERWIAFVASAAIVGAAGGLFAHFSNGFNPNDFFLDRTFLIVAMLIIGGVNSLGGAVVGALAVSALSEVLRQLEAGLAVGSATFDVPTGVGDVVLGLGLLVMLLVRPQGIVGNREIRWPFARVRTTP